MIVPMKKVTILVQSRDAGSAIRHLRSLGVMHVEHHRQPSGSDISSLKDDIAVLDRVIGILSSPGFRGSSGIRDAKLLKDWRFTARHITDLYARLDHLGEYANSLRDDMAKWEAWGDFDPALLKGLSEKGITVRFYEMPARAVGELPSGISVKTLKVIRGTAYCVVVSRDDVKVPFKEMLPPRIGPAEMRARLAENEDMARSIRRTIGQYTCFAERFGKVRSAFAKELELHEAARGMGSAGEIAYISGFVPVDRLTALSVEAKAWRWGTYVTDPSDEDNVPTLVRNPRWVSVISPVFRLIEIVPGYKELDISPVFLFALTLFFGMIIGDAGYGALYILATYLAYIKFGKKTKDHRIFFLLYIFSASAVFWGLLTGTVFGQEWYLKAGFKPLAGALNDTKFLQAFCFFIGAVHLTIAHAWQAVRKLPSLKALADAGWIFVIWAAFLLARMLILGDPLPAFCRWLIIGGVSLVIIGTSPQRNIFRMIASGLGSVALSIMNNFTDVVSYIRLFAVGLAGVAISDTVNSLAAGAGGNLIAQLLILLAGHTVNILLGPMSVLVHGVRLNVLEFSGHAGLSWSGTAYKPLEK